MRKIRLIKKVIPELVAYMFYDGEKSPEYRCKECGIHIMDNYRYCPHCGSELDWEHEDKKSKEFREFIESRCNVFDKDRFSQEDGRKGVGECSL